MRSIMLIAVALSCVVPTVAADDWSAYQPQVQALLADEATVPIEVGERWRAVEPQQNMPWPDEGVKYLYIGPKADYREGCAVIDEAVQQVVGLVGPEAVGPVPMNVMPREDAIPIAEAYARRHFPELFADGGEVTPTVADEISRLGAWMVTLQRYVTGVEVPAAAIVGVRVYDGKVPYWRRHYVPLDGGLQLPGEVTLEQAHTIADGNRPYAQHAPVFWFDEAHRVIVTEAGQRNVWDLWAEVKQPTTPENRLEFFAHWQIDAAAGEVLLSQGLNPGEEVELRRRYYAAGGTHVNPNYGRPSPEPMVTDSAPQWAGDGVIVFTSDRLRDGYPAWLKGPRGLFSVNADGSGLRCLVPHITALRFAVSPDGQRVAMGAGREGVRIISLAGGGEQVTAPPEKTGYTTVAWAGDGRVVVYMHANEEGRLGLVDLAAPEAEPVVLTPTHSTFGWSIGAIACSTDGSAVYYCMFDGVSWKLLKVATAGGAEPETVVAKLSDGQGMQVLDGGRALMPDSRSGTPGGMLLIDLTSGATEQWKAPRPSLTVPGTEHTNWAQPAYLRFSPDGERLVFASGIRDPSHTMAPATLIYTCSLDGSDIVQVTPWENELVAMVGE